MMMLIPVQGHCVCIYRSPSDSRTSSTDTEQLVELQLLHPSTSSSVWPHFPKTEKIIREQDYNVEMGKVNL